MAPGADDDLDWLYGRDRPAAGQPEPTRMLPTPEPGAAAAGPRPEPAPTASPVPPRAAPVPGPVPAPPRHPRRRRRPARMVLAVLGALALVFVLGVVAVPLYAWSTVSRVDEAPGGSRPADQPGTTFLLVGSDSRAGLTKDERKKLGTGSSAGQRTDTIMVMSIPPSGKPALVSIPRDSYVAIPEHGSNKINAAYAFGGPKLLVQTVEQQTGLRIDAYLEIGFGGFVNVIDSVGGIEMCLPKAIKDRDSHIDLPEGCQTLDGTNALGYVRMRQADVRGDLGRVERQRAMLAAVAKKAMSPASVLNPVRYYQLSTATAKSLKLGKGTSFLNMVSLASAMRKVAGDQGLTLTVPIGDPDASTSAGSAVLWDDKEAKQMFGDIARGDTSGLAKYAK